MIRGVCVPNGWVIKTYRHLNIPRSDYMGTKSLFEALHKDRLSAMKPSTGEKYSNRDITYGNYDRIQLVPVNSFNDFTNESSRAFNWYGSSQSILIFPLESDESKRPFKWGKDNKKKERVIIEDSSKNEQNTKNTFFGASFCYISDEARNRIRPYDKLMQYCNDTLTKLVDAYNKTIRNSTDNDLNLHGTVIAEAFGSLSSAELIILWSAQQYTDILYLMDCLRDAFLKYTDDDGDTDSADDNSLFRTTYTMISFPDLVKKLNDKNEIIEKEDTKFHNILGQAHIQFVMQDGIGEVQIKEFEQFFEKCLQNSARLIGEKELPVLRRTLNRCAGEYDLIGYVEGKYIPRLFINPENLHEEGWVVDEDDESTYFCTVHHPKYNKYVLYSFTRLSYRESDLPQVIKEEMSGREEWEKTRNKIVCIEISKHEAESDKYEIKKYTTKRSDLLNKIRDEYKELFSKLIDDIAERVPASSNLIMELNQLFSDYVQCCSSSADFLWIEDYSELFIQVMNRIRKSVLEIEVWKYYSEERSDGILYKKEWRQARERLYNISKLIEALHKQTSHISASTKLFFREQDIHFGYTAQHDLVLHAYYDIIKKLISYIYAYSDRHYQSKLYPLVNFDAGDMISSEIYTEESATDFRNELSNSPLDGMPSRIMVIHIPLDGLDNLMYYLPMLVHEVYHYASPKDRKRRNQILANIVTFQALRFGIYNALKDYNKDCYEKDKEKAGRMEIEFFDLADKVFYQVIEDNSDAIYAGIMADFYGFVVEGGQKSDMSDEIMLRSWFILWLRNWLNNVKNRNDGVSSDELHQSVYYNFCDLYHEVFLALQKALDGKISELEEQIKTGRNDTEEVKESLRIYIQLSKDLGTAIAKMMPDVDSDAAPDQLVQTITKGAYNYVVKYDRDLKTTLDVIDEIFPDMAMITYTQMDASGYMLQAALDFDKQLYSGDQTMIDHLRFGTIINYLLKKELRGKNNNTEAVLEKELEAFRQMYVAFYNIAVENRGNSDTGALSRANKWSVTFRNMAHMTWTHQGIVSFSYVFNWVDKLIEGMEECLALKDSCFSKECKEFFVDPYKKYLKILQMSTLEQKQKKLFKLSINMIQKFQNSNTMKSINEWFAAKDGADKSVDTRVRRLTPVGKYSNLYEVNVATPDAYMSAVQYSLERLYRYRDMEHISSSQGMWFRGVNNIEFPVVPSGFVHYTEDAARIQEGYPNVSYPLSYADVQLHNYESFRYSAEGTGGGVNPSNYYRTINYLTLMQHYQQHSNLLDWSEDYFGSSYFALEDEININDKYEYEKNKPENFRTANQAAVMYVLDPVRFNIACEEIEDKLHVKKNRKPGKYKNGLVIPNLSIDENQENYAEYHDVYGTRHSGGSFIKIKGPKGHPKEVSLSDVERYLVNSSDPDEPALELELPRAIYAAKLNERIRAQSGLFVAFSLGTVPIIWDDSTIETTHPSPGIFKYQALESIQEYYMTMPNKNPFMMVIKFPADIKKELGRMLYKCGISKEKIYPELDNYRHR